MGFLVSASVSRLHTCIQQLAHVLGQLIHLVSFIDDVVECCGNVCYAALRESRFNYVDLHGGRRHNTIA